MTEVVDPNVKKERSKRLIAVGNRIRNDFLSEHLGRPLEVLVEDERVIDGTSVCSGQTSDYVRVWFDNDCSFPNDPGMTERTVIARRDLLGRTVEVVGHEVRADGIRGGTIVDVAV